MMERVGKLWQLHHLSRAIASDKRSNCHASSNGHPECRQKEAPKGLKRVRQTHKLHLRTARAGSHRSRVHGFSPEIKYCRTEFMISESLENLCNFATGKEQNILSK